MVPLLRIGIVCINQKYNSELRIMYSTKTATTNNQEFTGSYMPVGINENITLKEVNVNKTQNGRDFLEIIFENSNGQTASMTEWKNEKNQWIKTDEELQRRDNVQFGRICQIIDCFYDKRPDAELNTFIDMINWVKGILDPMIGTNKPLRLKVCYDKKGYTQVSQNGIFVEKMEIADSQIKIFKKDLMERPVSADTEQNDPLNLPPSIIPDTVSENKNPADDLPF